MKKLVVLSIMIISLVSMSFNSTENSIKSIEGTWTYFAQDAPYEYQNGEFIFKKEEGKLKGFGMISENKIEFEMVTLKKNKVTFYTYIDGERISFDLEFKDKTFSGMASYSQGELEITGERKKK